MAGALARFDIEHTFRMLKQTLGWTCLKVRDPAADDTWTWLILAAYTQLRLARPTAADLRRPWERPQPRSAHPRPGPERISELRAKAAQPAGAPKPGEPGPGRPSGSRNGRPAVRHDVHVVTTGKAKKAKTGTPRPRRTG